LVGSKRPKTLSILWTTTTGDMAIIYFLIFLFIAIPVVTLIYIWNLNDDRPDLGGFGGRK
jgi:hypothetical protein